MNFDPEMTDVIVNRRKSKLNIEDEFLYDVKVSVKYEDYKRRCFDDISMTEQQQ